MVKDRQAELRDWVESDIIGSMLTSSSIKTKYTIYTEDIYNARLRSLYRHLINLSNEYGSFNQSDVLTDNVEANKYILFLMNTALTTNINVKCRWLVQR